MPARAKSICASPARRPGTPVSTASTRPKRAKLLAARIDVPACRFHPCRQPRVRLDRRAVQGARRCRAATMPSAVLRRLLHRRLSDAPDRPARTRSQRRTRSLRCCRNCKARDPDVRACRQARSALVTGASRGIGAATRQGARRRRRARRPHRPHGRGPRSSRGSDPSGRRHGHDRAARPWPRPTLSRACTGAVTERWGKLDTSCSMRRCSDRCAGACDRCRAISPRSSHSMSAPRRH